MIKNNNLKKEFYLTDLISVSLSHQLKVDAIKGNKKVSVGVNNQQELAYATRLVFRRKAKRLMEAGVLIIDPTTVYIEDSVQIDAGVVIYPNVYIRGQTKIGAFTSIEPNCYLVDAVVGEGVQIRANT